MPLESVRIYHSPKRSQFEIEVDILKALARHGSLKLTHIMHEVNVNYNTVKERLDFLTKANLAEKRNIDKRSIVYAITERGITALKHFRQLETIIHTETNRTRLRQPRSIFAKSEAAKIPSPLQKTIGSRLSDFQPKSEMRVEKKIGEKVGETSEKNLMLPDIFVGDEKPKQWGILGRTDESLVAVDLNAPHMIFVCGKQGSGKGYTISVLCEMLLSKAIPKVSQVVKPATILVFHNPREDTKSEFWSIIKENTEREEVKALEETYNVSPRKVISKEQLKIFIDPFIYEHEKVKFEREYQTQAIHPIGIDPATLTSRDWGIVLSLKRRNDTLYDDKIFQIIEEKQFDEDFGLISIQREITQSDLTKSQKKFAQMRLDMLGRYLETRDFIEDLEIGGINIFDFRGVMKKPEHVFTVMTLILSLLQSRESLATEPLVFVINEAHDYLGKGLSEQFVDYIEHLIRRKRHGFNWLILDTHFPEDIDPKILKLCDLKILHNFDVLHRSHILKPVIGRSERELDKLRTGEAIICADKSSIEPNACLLVNIRPRLTFHGAPTKMAV